MLRTITALALAAAVMAAVVGCVNAPGEKGTTEAGTTTATAASTTATTATTTEPSTTTSNITSTDNFPVFIDYITNDYLNNYKAFYEYGEGSIYLIKIWTKQIIKDFCFISIVNHGSEYNYTLIDYNAFPNEILYSIDEFIPEIPFILKGYLIPEHRHSEIGISFLNENGVIKYYQIKWSGRDGLFFAEIINDNILPTNDAIP